MSGSGRGLRGLRPAARAETAAHAGAAGAHARILVWGMAIIDQIKADAQSALRAGEKHRVGALRLLISELQKAAKEGSEDELAVLRRERKRRVEAARAYGELKAIVDQAVRDSGAESMKDMGRVMKQAMAAVGGRADGEVVSGLVRASLQG